MDCVPALPKGQWSPLRGCYRPVPAQDVLQLWMETRVLRGQEMEPRSLDGEGSSSRGLQRALQAQKRLQ